MTSPEIGRCNPPPPKLKKNLIYSLQIFFCEFLIHEWDVNVFELFHEDSIIACRKKSSKDPVLIRLLGNVNFNFVCKHKCTHSRNWPGI